MLDSEQALKVVSRCGGIFKPSLIKGFIVPKTFIRFLIRRNELFYLYRRFKGEGEFIYHLPQNIVRKHWSFTPNQLNDFSLFRSFALLLYFSENRNLPYTKELKTKYFPDFPSRTFNGVYPTIDDLDDSEIIIILDYQRTTKMLVEIINSLRNPLEKMKSPQFHVVTKSRRVGLENELNRALPEERVKVFEYPQLIELI